MRAHRTFQLLALTLALVSASPLAQSPGKIYDPGNGVSLPVVVTQVRAEYTAAAMKARIEGVVVLESVVLEDGTVGEIRIKQSLDSLHGLDLEAVAAMRKWRFRPGQRDGKPVAVRIYCEMKFTLAK